MKLTKDQRKIFSKIGRKGGRATLKKHGRKKLAAWGKLGGRPKNPARKSGDNSGI